MTATTAYPVLEAGDSDPRIPHGLTLDVDAAPVRHGNPPFVAGVDLVRLQAALSAAPYGERAA